MLSFNEIQKEFDAGLTGINAYRAMLKEYLQSKVLEFIYRGPFKGRLVFIGGTKLRLLNKFRRFSEDLDFDISGSYESKDHRALCEYLVAEFQKQNISAEIDGDKKISEVDVYTRYLNFPGFMEQAGIVDAPGRKFFIKIDAQKHAYGAYSYQMEQHILNRFDVFVPVNCAPDSMILATKLCAILERSKGRDFYDIVELVKTVKPDTQYIANRLEFGSVKKEYTGPASYVELALEAMKKVDWKDKTKEIERFLFFPEEAVKVQMFPSFATKEVMTSWLEH